MLKLSLAAALFAGWAGGALAQVSTPPSGASGGGSDRPVATGSGSTVTGSPAMTPGKAATTGAITLDPRDQSTAPVTGSSATGSGNTSANPPPPQPQRR